MLVAPGGLHRLQFPDLWLGSHQRTGLGVNPLSQHFFFLRLFCPYYFWAVAWIPTHMVPWPLADIAGILVSCFPLPHLLWEASLTKTVPTDPLASVLQPTHQTHWPFRHQLSLWPLHLDSVSLEGGHPLELAFVPPNVPSGNLNKEEK